MEVNFDLLVSGCDTRCRHCYVNGGPGKNMPTEDALTCIRKLDEIAAGLPFAASFTLDNEPCRHPEIRTILRTASSVRHITCFHHGMTSGIALMRRPDKDAVVQAYLDSGWKEFGITLHGRADHHDEIVCRAGACETALEAASYLRERGADVSVSLMINRFFPEDAAGIDAVLRQLNPAFVFAAVPNYTPHRRMMGYESYRPSREDLEALAPWLSRWCPGRRPVEWSSPEAVVKLLEQGLMVQELFRQEQQELYLSVHPDCLLYLGNTGAETALLGDLRTLDVARAADAIRLAPGNRDYGAFYALEDLPEQGVLIRALKRIPQDRLYADPASVIYRGLEELQIPTRILPTGV